MLLLVLLLLLLLTLPLLTFFAATAVPLLLPLCGCRTCKST